MWKMCVLVLLVWASAALAQNDAAVFDLCKSPVYCHGDLLKTIQLKRIFKDSKTFVDLYQKQDEEVTVENFKQMMQKTNNDPTLEDVKTFVKDNFEDVNELINVTLNDWRPNPYILDKIADPNYRQWASALNYIWNTLARRMSDDVANHPSRHSLIYVNNTFIIPGGRFKEFYYWDSYWVVEGLLQTQMYETTRGIIENFLSIVRTYGFIPNGGRVYYLMRSQPPLLIPMVDRYYEFTKDWAFVDRNLQTLEKEFNFFMQHKSVVIKKNNKSYKMAYYVVNSEGPRPESYREDYELAEKTMKTEESRRKFYNNVKAGAESGWDFSARWFIARNGTASLELADIATENVIPVDLNAFLEKNARILARFFKIKNNTQKVKYYTGIAAEFREAIHAVLWHEEDGTWYDYDRINRRPRRIFYASNLAPLYTQSFDPIESRYKGKRSVEYLKANRIDEFQGGIPTSLDNSSQQWDLPNAWPPLQSFVVQGLRKSSYKGAKDMAQKLAEIWLRSNYLSFNSSKKMFEKYDAVNPGKSGGGGEYPVQEGFGWSNGVALEFLDAYPRAKYYHDDSKDSNANRPIPGKEGPPKETRPRLILKSIWSHYCQ